MLRQQPPTVYNTKTHKQNEATPTTRPEQIVHFSSRASLPIQIPCPAIEYTHKLLVQCVRDHTTTAQLIMHNRNIKARDCQHLSRNSSNAPDVASSFVALQSLIAFAQSHQVEIQVPISACKHASKHQTFHSSIEIQLQTNFPEILAYRFSQQQ